MLFRRSLLVAPTLCAMERRSLGPLEISAVGVGTAPLGSSPDWVIWWGKQDMRAGVRAVQRALDLGVNWIDTAPFYGWGRAEELVGRAIARSARRRPRLHEVRDLSGSRGSPA